MADKPTTKTFAISLTEFRSIKARLKQAEKHVTHLQAESNRLLDEWRKRDAARLDQIRGLEARLFMNNWTMRRANKQRERDHATIRDLRVRLAEKENPNG